MKNYFGIRCTLLSFVIGFVLASIGQGADDEQAQLLKKSRRVLFLGDSITAAGRYVASFDAWLRSTRPATRPEIINCGLPSETVSGLSEEGHAGGKFPRPNLAERLDRVLALVQPDLVVACYGINCGIYQPFDPERFQQYQRGIRSLKRKVEAANATLILMTPPFYDGQRTKLPFSYNEVLDRYSEWLLERRSDGWLVVDLHHPMTQYVQERRKELPEFTLQPDGVHPNDDGHWFVAQQLIAWFGDKDAAAAPSVQALMAKRQVPDGVFAMVQQRSNLLRDAYVGSAGHKRPGVAAGLPVAEATAKAKELDEQINALLKP